MQQTPLLKLPKGGSGTQHLGLASAGYQLWQKLWGRPYRPSDGGKQDQIGGRSRPIDHTLVVSSTQGTSVDWKWGGRMWWVRSELAAGEARKTKGASCTQPLTPRPPDLTGSKAWVQAASSRSMLVMSLTMNLRVSS